MTIIVNFKVERLVGITRRQFLQGNGGPIRTEIAAAINRMGDTLTSDLSYEIGLNLNMSPETVRTQIRIQRANRGRLEYVIDATTLASKVSSPGSGRRLPGRTFGAPAQPEQFLHAGQLVKIVNAEDSMTCEICKKLAEGTYRIEEARTLVPAHPNCRCTIKEIRRMDGRPGPGPADSPTMTTPSGARPERGNSSTVNLDDYLAHLSYDIRAAMQRAVLKVT